jgi:lipoprotein-releasing system permease protein
MFRPIELFVGLRYTRAKRRNHFISFISLTSMVGIALGVTALITVLSVMNGFEEELRTRILGMASHASVGGANGRLEDWRVAAAEVERHPNVVGTAPFVRGETMLANAGRVSGAVVQGILPEAEPRVSEVDRHMKEGELGLLKAGEYNIILGQELAWTLGVRIGDPITVITPQAQFSPTGVLPRLRRFTLVGIFEVGMYEYDRGIAFIHMEDGARLFRLDDAVSGVRIKLDDLFAAPRIARELGDRLPPSLRVDNWTRQHANFFRAVKMEKRVMFIILTLIVAVAAFNIVSTLVMVVTDKQSDIAILRTLGATPLSIMGIFMVQGALIGTLGTLFGAVGGYALATNLETLVPAIEQAFDVHFMAPDVYYISDLPSKLVWADFWRITGMAFVLSLLATLYPAWRASRTQPAEALRYE